MDEQISKLDKRLTSVENEVETLRAVRQEIRLCIASKEDFLRLENHIALLHEQAATKQDVQRLELNLTERQATLEKNVANDMGELRLQITRLELRILRWLIGTVISVSGIIVAVVKFWV
ncbi:hypothetical protein [Duganella fentianensis]|uniref:hypothetical protein n=1 Tax=Duganella fentianensis TaxID=2692177 RepID=UPI0032B20C18